MAGFTDKYLKGGVWLIGVNLALYVAYLAAHWCGSASAWQVALSLPSDFASLCSRPWSPLSYMFTQYNFTHLLFNMLWLWAAVMIARSLDLSRRVVAVYIAGGVTGALLFLLTSAFTGQTHSLVGSSAAVLALMAFCTAKSPYHKISLYGFSVRLIWIAAFLTILLFVGSSGIWALMAHLGGVAAGVAAGVINLGHRPSRTEVTHADLDQLLEKVRLSGYESLSAKEKNALHQISKKL